MATKRAGPRARQGQGGGDPSKRALLVAINNYGNPQNDLPSCLEDAAKFRSVLQSHYGFENFTELYDGDATVANVEAGLSWLLKDAAADDRLVFYYSGHGYQQPRGGNLEECLVLGNLEFLFDDRLSEFSRSAPPGVLSVILDSCFSGGMEKRIPLGEGVEVARTKLWVPPPDAARGKSLAAGPLVPRPFGCLPVTGETAVKRLVLGTEVGPDKAAGPQEASQDEAGQMQLNGLLLSACRENETSSASTSATKGMSAFTFALTGTLPASGEISNARIHEDVRDRLAELGFQQVPLLRVPPRPPGLDAASFVTLVPVAAAAPDQPTKSLPSGAGANSTTPAETRGNPTMANNQAYDEQFWQTVERVAAQVASAAEHEAAGGRKALAPAPRPATASPTNEPDSEAASAGGARPTAPAATQPNDRPGAGSPDGRGPGSIGNGEAPAAPPRRPAPAAGASGGMTGAAGGELGSSGNGQASDPATLPAPPTAGASASDGVEQGEQKWIGAALSLVSTVAPMVINAIRGRHKDFTPDGADGDEKLMAAVADVVTPAVIDAIARRPKDFTVDPSPNGSGEEGEAKFPWGAVARVVGSAVPSIIGEIFKRKDFSADLPAGSAATEDDNGPGLVVGAVAPAVIQAMARRHKDIGANGQDDAVGDDKGIPWGAVARIAASVVPSVVTEISHRKIYAPGMPPSHSPGFAPLPPGAGERGERRCYAL